MKMENGTTVLDERKPARARTKPPPADGDMHITIKAPDLRIAEFAVRGTAPYVQCRFPQKAVEQMKAKHEAGSTAKGKKVREKRDFDEDYRQSMHRSREGWNGIPCSAFRCAMIDSCRLVGFHMTLSRMSIFVLPDGIDILDGTPLIRIYGEHERLISHVRNDSGVTDLRARAIWHEW